MQVSLFLFVIYVLRTSDLLFNWLANTGKTKCTWKITRQKGLIECMIFSMGKYTGIMKENTSRIVRCAWNTSTLNRKYVKNIKHCHTNLLNQTDYLQIHLCHQGSIYQNSIFIYFCNFYRVLVFENDKLCRWITALNKMQEAMGHWFYCVFSQCRYKIEYRYLFRRSLWRQIF